MTPTEMVRTVLDNIERARAAMEDGPVGYVLHTKDHVHFVINHKAAPYKIGLGDPLDDDVAVYTSYPTAETAQRYWNVGRLNDGHTLNRVIVSLRREALAGYISVQQRTLDVLTEMGGGQ